MGQHRVQAVALKVILLTLVATSGANMAEAKGNNQPKQSTAPQPLLKEYRTVTLQVLAGFTPEKTEIVLGEPLSVTFSIKNIGKKEFGYWFGGDYRGTGRHEKIRVRVTDAEGNLLRDPKARPDGTVLDLGGKSWVTTVKPGETSKREFVATDYRTIDKPGEYTVRCAFGIERGGPDLERIDETPIFTVETTFPLKVLPRTEANVSRVLGEYIKRARQGTGDTLRQAVAVAASFGGERAVADLATLAAEGDAEHRIAALAGLGRFTTTAAVGAALKAQRDADVGVRIAAAEALGSMKMPAAVEGLLERLKVETPKVVVALLPALGRTDSPRALSPLVEALDHPNVEVRRAAAVGLGELQSGAALITLQRCATDD